MHRSPPPAQPADTARPVRQLLLSVWVPRAGVFTARAILADGSTFDFDNPFELVRFLAAAPLPPDPSNADLHDGLR
jgi:hypothetical protein